MEPITPLHDLNAVSTSLAMAVMQHGVAASARHVCPYTAGVLRELLAAYDAGCAEESRKGTERLMASKRKRELEKRLADLVAGR